MSRPAWANGLPHHETLQYVQALAWSVALGFLIGYAVIVGVRSPKRVARAVRRRVEGGGK